MTPNIQTARKNIIPTSQDMKSKKRPKPLSNNNKQKQQQQQSAVDPSSGYNNKENDRNNAITNAANDPNSMDFEVEAAISLILRFIQNSQRNNNGSLQMFKDRLFKDLVTAYTGHWYPDRPIKGSAFRCLRINQNGSDSLIEKTAKSVDAHWIVDSLPKEFTIWIDPSEVSYRIGEEGSICVHYTKKSSTKS